MTINSHQYLRKAVPNTITISVGNGSALPD